MQKNSKKGFTLAELLIVVAVIGVLVGVSIPIFSAQLEKAREATDIANLRDAKAAAVAKYLDNNESAGTYFYDAEKGILVDDKDGITPYGKGTAKAGQAGEEGKLFFLSQSGETKTYYMNTDVATDKLIQVVITDTNASDGEADFALSWVAAE